MSYRRGVQRRLVIDERFRGFPGYALGAYVGGTLATVAGRALEVKLRGPAPVGETLVVETTADQGVCLRSGGDVLAEGSPWSGGLTVPEPVSVERAVEATQGYMGFGPHGFAPQLSCFVCGPGRSEGDGLRIFPGAVSGGVGPMVAAAWTPHPAHAGPDGVVPVEIVWSALDCPAIWALIASSPADSAEEVVSGTIATTVIGEVTSGSPLVIVGWPAGAQGRRRFAGAALFAADGRLLAKSRQTCVVAEGGAPLGARRWSEVRP